MNDTIIPQAVEHTSFLLEHFDAIITVLITVLGFVITYLMTKKNFKDEVTKNKLTINAEIIRDLPYEVCKLMDRFVPKGGEKQLTVAEYSDLLAKILAYGSKNAVSIATHMQQLSYSNAANMDIQKKWELLSCYALLTSQIKYDLTSEVISPESWFKLKLNDYETIRPEIVNKINYVVEELSLIKSFHVKE